MVPLAKGLIVLGLMMIVLGMLLWAASSIPLIGRLPGDIYVKRGNFSFYFPLTTCILLSIILSVLFMLIRR